MTFHIGPYESGQAHPTTVAQSAAPTTTLGAYSAPINLADVALIDGPTAAAVGSMSLSSWHEEVAAGRAPQPVIRQPRCTRWRLADVRAYWMQRAEQGSGVGAQVIDRAKRASAAAKAKRRTQAARAGA